ncbi:hypothetical protein GYMLUDRAFT_265478 [Collybiopsis luxurians FD-317 M1]|uniref:Uncharacterized protein n=1 Tax=Collybiopsis luxurians FD-317 M1 TaxID=944289 RepID=A0A0D0BRV3_9AGAR|nr:hypothetical protein GYMLUDRAFT_265478 [Collybiopsis luxurians FD-317 M1]
MALPALLNPSKVVISVAPLKLIQENHDREFNELGIRSILINGDTIGKMTSSDWKAIENHSTYRHYALSPEQVRPGSSHTSKFFCLLHNQKWAKKIFLLNYDECHFIETAGTAHDDKTPAFCPVLAQLGDLIRLQLAPHALCAVFSASLTPHIRAVTMSSLHMTEANTTNDWIVPQPRSSQPQFPDTTLWPTWSGSIAWERDYICEK